MFRTDAFKESVAPILVVDFKHQATRCTQAPRVNQRPEPAHAGNGAARPLHSALGTHRGSSARAARARRRPFRPQPARQTARLHCAQCKASPGSVEWCGRIVRVGVGRVQRVRSARGPHLEPERVIVGKVDTGIRPDSKPAQLQQRPPLTSQCHTNLCVLLHGKKVFMRPTMGLASARGRQARQHRRSAAQAAACACPSQLTRCNIRSTRSSARHKGASACKQSHLETQMSRWRKSNFPERVAGSAS